MNKLKSLVKVGDNYFRLKKKLTSIFIRPVPQCVLSSACLQYITRLLEHPSDCFHVKSEQ